MIPTHTRYLLVSSGRHGMQLAGRQAGAVPGLGTGVADLSEGMLVPLSQAVHGSLLSLCCLHL